MLIEANERDGIRRGGSLRTLGSDSVGRVPGQLGGRVCRALCVGRVEGVGIGRAGPVLGYWGWELWNGFFVEAGEDLFVQVVQVYIDRRKLWSGHGRRRESVYLKRRMFADNTLSGFRLSLD